MYVGKNWKTQRNLAVREERYSLYGVPVVRCDCGHCATCYEQREQERVAKLKADGKKLGILGW